MIKQRPDYRKEVRTWAKRMGVREAERALVIAGVSVAMAYKLARGTYRCRPKQDACDMIDEAMDNSESEQAS